MEQFVDQRSQNVLMMFNIEGRLPQGIHAAAGDIDLLDEAIDEQPVNADAGDSFQETPLHIAATYGRFEIIKVGVFLHVGPSLGIYCGPIRNYKRDDARQACASSHARHVRST